MCVSDHLASHIASCYRLQRTLYSKKNALRSETGGLMEALRKLRVEESTSSSETLLSPRRFQNADTSLHSLSLSPLFHIIVCLHLPLVSSRVPRLSVHSSQPFSHCDWTLARPRKTARDAVQEDCAHDRRARTRSRCSTARLEATVCRVDDGGEPSSNPTRHHGNRRVP